MHGVGVLGRIGRGRVLGMVVLRVRRATDWVGGIHDGIVVGLEYGPRGSGIDYKFVNG